MERNGLPDRLREAKIGYWVLGVCGFLLVSFFIAPMTLEEGSVGPLQGRANAIDYYSEDGRVRTGINPRTRGRLTVNVALLLLGLKSPLRRHHLRIRRRELPSKSERSWK